MKRKKKISFLPGILSLLALFLIQNKISLLAEHHLQNVSELITLPQWQPVFP